MLGDFRERGKRAAGAYAKRQAKAYLKRLAWAAAKKGAALAAKGIAALIAMVGWPVLLVLLAVVLAVLLFAAVYSAMPGDQHLTGVEPSELDAAYRAYAEERVAEMNVKETWVVDGEGAWYPAKGNYVLGRLADRYGQDAKLVNRWGDAYAPALYAALQAAGQDRMADRAWAEARMREAAEALRPWFYYKESKVIYCGKDGCEEEPVYLLVEAYTIRGHYRYRYEWVTEHRGGGSVTYERLKDVETVSDGRPYLESYLAKALELEPGSEDVRLAAEMVFNAGEAFTGRKEWMAWLDRALGGAFAWASAAAVPPEFRAFLEEAEARTGIPWWLLAGLIQVESSWNPLAVNQSTGCFGLTQIDPKYWPERARAAGFDPERDRWNPRAQIIAGAVYLAGLFDVRAVPWQGNWREDPGLLAALARYGGYGTDVNRAQGYIQKVLAAAEGLRTPAAWPVPGYTRITSYFGMRLHPTLGVWRMHNGVDIAAPEGAQVVSVSGGIAYVFWDAKGGGLTVSVKDGAHEYVYCHLSQALVVSGQTVRPGDPIGLVGQTGEATGPHLHFGVKILDTGSWIDPLLVLRS